MKQTTKIKNAISAAVVFSPWVSLLSGCLVSSGRLVSLGIIGVFISIIVVKIFGINAA